ncbi:MAG: NTP transferase domain-containing protein [Lachnospiraceae bacterium]|nr:NTP transferase domain-containing protein [Lachnospiraceae bacterium]
MKIGALIAAAGLPESNSTCGPLDNIGTITAIERIVATLRNAGISRIVAVTGHNSDELERLLTSSHVIFIKNENYETTDMLESVKHGLRYLQGKCDRILFTPADLPLFTSNTIQSLLLSNSPIAVPVCKGVPGHPVLFSADYIEDILSYRGDGGLQEAFRWAGGTTDYVEVDDRGILVDEIPGSSDEYQKLLNLHNRNLVRVNLRIGLAREKIFFDEQVFTLLMLIDETGNVREACNRMHISYTTSWNLIQRLENELHCPLVARTKGGLKGSHSELTAQGKEFLELYARFTEELRTEASALFRKRFRDFFKMDQPEQGCSE